MGLFSKEEKPDFSALAPGWYKFANITLGESPESSWTELASHGPDGWDIYQGESQWQMMDEQLFAKQVHGYLFAVPEPISEQEAQQIIASQPIHSYEVSYAWADGLKDHLGLGLDPEIFDLILALHRMGVVTTQSCAGHAEHGLACPWIDFHPDSVARTHWLMDKYGLAGWSFLRLPDVHNGDTYRLMPAEMVKADGSAAFSLAYLMPDSQDPAFRQGQLDQLQIRRGDLQAWALRMLAE